MQLQPDLRHMAQCSSRGQAVAETVAGALLQEHTYWQSTVLQAVPDATENWLIVELRQPMALPHCIFGWCYSQQQAHRAVASIAAGAGHVLAVTECGQVWGWGRNAQGQLGLGHSRAWVAAPTEVTAALEGAWKGAAEVITSAACGDAHSALLAASGAVFTAGCNRQGQCGQDPALQLCPVFCQPSLPGSNPDPIKAAAVACGTANTAIASRQGRLLVCGDASSGQCGQSCVKQRCCWQLVDLGPELGWHGLTRPTAAEVAAAGGAVAQALPKVVDVAVGCGTCYALTDGGDVYAWGAGSKGQLGRGGCAKVQATPAKLPWAKRIVQMSVSLDGHFAAAVDAAGHLYTWGAGKWGQLGHGDTSKRTVGRAVKQLKQSDVLQVVCGSESLLVLTRPGAFLLPRSSQGLQGRQAT
ncbi:hypothetical protein OEZ85_003720 [Tetradesmus obliquus]|uniref:RCC1-like domain-containing protein n=1 Tax=Tetradesmus obliquus TaxID=3088 RepID=A0ABY8UCP1_TETOB|nr:hypothetical protein OEZ85_003720 [Tetradesmus obliquus]